MSGSGEGNDTMSCAARNIQGPVELPLPFLLPLVTRCLLIIYYMLIGFLGTVLNGVVLFVVCKHKKLRTLSFAYVIQVVVINTIRSGILVPIAFVNAVYNQFLLGQHMCFITGNIHEVASLLRALLFLGLVTDRFCLVFFTYSYPKYRVKALWTVTVIVYLIVAVDLIFIGIFDCLAFSFTSWICRVATTCSTQCITVQMLVGLGIRFPCSLVPVVMYIALFYKGWKARKSMPVSASDLTGEAKREWRATITFSLMFFSLFLCNVPSGMINGIINLVSISRDSVWFYIVDTLTLNLFYLANIADPFFILRNRDVREVMKEITWIPKILCCAKCFNCQEFCMLAS